MKTYKFIAGDPADGTLVTGVVYYVSHEAAIHKHLGLQPIGYIGEDLTAELVFADPQPED